MADVHVTADVAAPLTEVFAYLSDLENLGEWDSSVRSATKTADTGPAVGRRYDVEIGFYGKQLEAVYEITDYECGRALGWSITGRANGSTRIELTATETGTRIDYRTELKMRGLAKLLDKGLGAALEGIGENIAAGLVKRLDA